MPAANKKRLEGAKAPKTSASYTYTGCWTCRRRHIKCDEQKPTCHRCTKAGYECQGYDFRFGASAGSSRSFRRPVASGSSGRQTATFSNAEVSKILDELDLTTTSAERGPFAVLAFDIDASIDQHASQPPSPGRAGIIAIRTKTNSVAPPSSQDSGYVSSGYISPEGHIRTDASIAWRCEPMVPVMMKEPHLLKVPPMQVELFEHWTLFLCNNMSPMAKSSANPFRYLYPSLALEGLMVTPDMGAPRLAVFHGICGTAAWSLSKMKPDNMAYRAVSVSHDQLALKYIQHTIEQPGGIQDAAIPAAIMTCLTGDVLSGRLDLWGRHLHGGFRCLLTVLARQRVADGTMSSLCQQYLLSAAFANFGSPSEIDMLRLGVLDDYTYIQECHCLTRAMVDVMFAINHLVKSDCRGDPTAIERVRLQLNHSVPQFPDLIRYHISHAYYYAITIYFSRSFRESANTHQLAARAMDHLEWAKATGEGNPGKILMWCLFTIAPACSTPELKVRLLTWCNSQVNVNVSNMDHFVGLLQQTWSLAKLDSMKNADTADAG